MSRIGRLKVGSWPGFVLGGALSLGVIAQQAHEPVRQGPEAVFSEPVDALFDELAEARATGRNARIGAEFVYWGYELPAGRELFLFACAPLDDIDCDARSRQICPAGGTVVARRDIVGLVRDLDCRSVSLPGAGDRRPGCRDQEVENRLDVGVVECN